MSQRRWSLATLCLLAAMGAVSGCEAPGTISPDPDASPSAPTWSATLGREGGVLRFEGGSLTVPAGALSSPVVLRVTRTTNPAPAGWEGDSPVFRFEPSGLVFSVPATVALTLRRGGPGVAVWWTSASGWEGLATEVAGLTASASVTHFSEGFAGSASSETDAGTPDALDASRTDAPDARPEASLDARLDARPDGGDGATLDALDAPRTDALDAPPADAGPPDAGPPDTLSGCPVGTARCGSECVPSTEPPTCGAENCGGACGECPTGFDCDTGRCVRRCVPSCEGRNCGSDGCGGWCGTCGLGRCESGRCVACVPRCPSGYCGADGCGGACPACPTGQRCDLNYCVPNDGLPRSSGCTALGCARTDMYYGFPCGVCAGDGQRCVSEPGGRPVGSCGMNANSDVWLATLRGGEFVSDGRTWDEDGSPPDLVVCLQGATGESCSRVFRDTLWISSPVTILGRPRASSSYLGATWEFTVYDDDGPCREVLCRQTFVYEDFTGFRSYDGCQNPATGHTIGNVSFGYVTD